MCLSGELSRQVLSKAAIDYSCNEVEAMARSLNVDDFSGLSHYSLITHALRRRRELKIRLSFSSVLNCR